MYISPLSLALVDLPVAVPAGSDLFRAQVTYAKDAGFRAVHLNAAAPGMRPRELDRSARRDLAAMLKRNEVSSSGADLWIPPEHFTDPTHVDRAVAATLAAVEFVADLDRLIAGAGARILCLSLPENVSDAVLAAISQRAADCGTRVANFGPPTDRGTPGVLGPGFDPAAAILASAASSLVDKGGVIPLPSNLAGARLSDANSVGRVAPGSPGGRLDLTAYAISLAAAGYHDHVVLDVRGVADPQTAARQALAAWERIGKPVA